jgi:hypothetical protein
MAARLVGDPIENPRWQELVARHPSSSIFHSAGWLNALRQTYGYEPFVVTMSEGAAIDNGVVACRVKGWTSERVVSLPFSDHCEPLIDDRAQRGEGLAFLLAHARRIGAASVEIRPASDLGDAFGAEALQPAATYCFHRIDLRDSEAALFRRLHPSSTRRAIRKAEREGLQYESGRSDELLGRFYELLRMTRRRHGVPPQPLAWFRNLLSNLGEQVSIHLASKDERPVAALLSLSFKQTVY